MPNPPPAPVSDAAMRELCNLAHPGPWFATIDDADFPVVTAGRANDWLACASCDNPHSADDMAFIAAARSWIPAALERLALMSGPPCDRCKIPTVAAGRPSVVAFTSQPDKCYSMQQFLCPSCHGTFLNTKDAPAPRESESER